MQSLIPLSNHQTPKSSMPISAVDKEFLLNSSDNDIMLDVMAVTFGDKQYDAEDAMMVYEELWCEEHARPSHAVWICAICKANNKSALYYPYRAVKLAQWFLTYAEPNHQYWLSSLSVQYKRRR